MRNMLVEIPALTQFQESLYTLLKRFQQLHVCDIYYFNIAQFLEGDFDEIVVEGKEKAFSLYCKGTRFNEIDHDFGFYDKAGQALVFKDENDHPKFRVDIVPYRGKMPGV